MKKNENRETAPGAPIAWDKPSQPEEVQPGYGFIPDNESTEETFYYHSDHLGSTSYVTDDSARITQYTAYLPYGELLVDEHSSSEDMPYKFNGKELDEETGLYYYGARYMQPIASIWYGIDPLTEKYPDVSAYVYCMGNPVKYIDLDGKETYVSANKDGTYTVKGGVINKDNGIYCINGKKKQLIGYSATPYSFFNPNTKEPINGVIINPQDNSGRDFLNNTILSPDMDIITYMINATPNEKYDFKKTNGTDNVISTDDEYTFRGMPLNLKGDNPNIPVYASARDVGNIAAGLIAGSNGIMWDGARVVFDGLETLQYIKSEKRWLKEAPQTQYAQYIGYKIGCKIFNAKIFKIANLFLSERYQFKDPKISGSIIKLKR